MARALPPSSDSNWRLALIGLSVLVLDQLTKMLVLQNLGTTEEREVLPGFFRLVHWHNTGAAWSLFTGNNASLAAIALGALVVLVVSRRHFDVHRLGGLTALGLILGGITGNLADRILRQHVVDFLYFYVNRRDGLEAGFPAFNVADSAICIGVVLLFFLSLQTAHDSPAPEKKAAHEKNVASSPTTQAPGSADSSR